MAQKEAQNILRSTEISEEEREAARKAISAFNSFLKKLWAARQHDKRLVNVLQKNKKADSADLFEVRHLLRRFQKEVKQRYADLIFLFAGKKDFNTGNVLEKGCLHLLQPLENDTTTKNLKDTLQNSVQQLTEFVEEFLEAFEDFNDSAQIDKIVKLSNKIDSIVQSIENIIDSQLKPHFEKNILIKKTLSEIRSGIKKRARLIYLMEK